MTNNLKNVTWAEDRVASESGNTERLYAWNTDTGDMIADKCGKTIGEAGRKLFQALRKYGFRGETLISKNGDQLTASGPISRIDGSVRS